LRQWPREPERPAGRGNLPPGWRGPGRRRESESLSYSTLAHQFLPINGHVCSSYRRTCGGGGGRGSGLGVRGGAGRAGVVSLFVIFYNLIQYVSEQPCKRRVELSKGRSGNQEWIDDSAVTRQQQLEATENTREQQRCSESETTAT
jgi:hypothetical protein